MMQAVADKKVLLQVDHLKQYFPVKTDSLFKPKAYVKAVDDISFKLYEGETLSIVGESGCGKSTTGRAILRLDEPTDGKVYYSGTDILGLNKKEMRKLRRDLQVIFQDPFASLNPRQTVKQILNEAMAIQDVVEKSKEWTECLNFLAMSGFLKRHLTAILTNLAADSVNELGLPEPLQLILN